MKGNFATRGALFILLAAAYIVYLSTITGCQLLPANGNTDATPTATVASNVPPIPTSTATPLPSLPTATANPAITPTNTLVPAPSPTVQATATSSPVPAGTKNPATLTGFMIPVKGAPIPSYEGQLPGAPRAYRNGIHEGIDFYYTDAKGSPVTTDTEVFVAKGGKVIRADLNYVEVTQAEMDRMLAETQRVGNTPPDILDRLRGRQVWIDVGDGVITRYVHLDKIAPGIREGVEVKKGQFLGYAGNSGTPEAASGVKDDAHLHFEIWINGKYFGQGMTPAEIRALLPKVFSG